MCGWWELEFTQGSSPTTTVQCSILNLLAGASAVHGYYVKSPSNSDKELGKVSQQQWQGGQHSPASAAPKTDFVLCIDSVLWLLAQAVYKQGLRQSLNSGSHTVSPKDSASTEKRAKHTLPGSTASAHAHLKAVREDVLHTSEWIRFFHCTHAKILLVMAQRKTFQTWLKYATKWGTPYFFWPPCIGWRCAAEAEPLCIHPKILGPPAGFKPVWIVPGMGKDLLSHFTHFQPIMHLLAEMEFALFHLCKVILESFPKKGKLHLT